MNQGKHHASYSLETKLGAVKDHVELGMTEVDVMHKYGIHSFSLLLTWCRLYKNGGPEALKPRPKGRPRVMRNRPKPALTREQQLVNEVEFLKTKLAYLEKLRALQEEEHDGRKV